MLTIYQSVNTTTLFYEHYIYVICAYLIFLIYPYHHIQYYYVNPCINKQSINVMDPNRFYSIILILLIHFVLVNNL